MSFLAPVFAFFTVLAAVPIVIHLIGRNRARPRAFAAMELLLASQRRVAVKSRMRHVLLLAVRALAILAVPLILARPFWETTSDLPAAVGGTQSAVIVIDDSLSMRYSLGGRPLVELARERAKKILDALGSDAEAAILTGSKGGGAPVGELTHDRARLVRAIEKLAPSSRGTDLTGALRRAAQLLQHAARPRRVVYLVSDMAAHGFADTPPWAAGRGPELVPVDVAGGASLDNHAVTDLVVEPAPQLGPRGLKVTVEVANFSDQALTNLPVTLSVDGRAVAKGLVDVPARTRARKRFLHTFPRDAAAPETGVHDLVAETARDALPDDDRRFARVEVRRDVRVLVVDGDPRTLRREDETFYLETALRPGDRWDSELDVTAVTAEALAAQRLGDFDVVFLCNVTAPKDVGPLVEYVRGGGGLFIAVGDRVEPEAYNRAFASLLPHPVETLRTVGLVAGARADGEVAPAGEGEGERLGAVDRAHPLLAPLGSALGAEAGLDAIRFARFALVRPGASSDERRILLRLAGGAPLLIERTVGAGRVLFLGTTIDRDWTDLPIQPLFLPLVQQATRYLARAPSREPEAPLGIGERHEIALDESAERLEVTLPSGTVKVLGADRVAGRRRVGFGETEEPGLYRVATAATARDNLRPQPSATFVVNLDPVESDLTRIAPARLAALSAGGGAKPGDRAPRRRVELWHALGAALLALLLVEAVLLRRK